MFSVSRTFDENFIHSCVSASWDAVTDDGSTRFPDLYFPDVGGHNIWLQVQHNGESLGVFLASPHGVVCREVHSALLPAARGVSAEASKAAIDWLFTNTQCVSILAWVPEYHRFAVRMALNSGLKVLGRNQKSFLKNGILYDEILLGVSKGK